MTPVTRYIHPVLNADNVTKPAVAMTPSSLPVLHGNVEPQVRALSNDIVTTRRGNNKNLSETRGMLNGRN
jgi:hypothetical protein